MFGEIDRHHPFSQVLNGAAGNDVNKLSTKKAVIDLECAYRKDNVVVLSDKELVLQWLYSYSWLYPQIPSGSR